MKYYTEKLWILIELMLRHIFRMHVIGVKFSFNLARLDLKIICLNVLLLHNEDEFNRVKCTVKG
jgi:hypothetical protein